MAGGVALGTLIPLRLWMWVAALAVCGVMAAVLSRKWRRIGSLYVWFAILFFGAAAARAHTPREVIPRGERVWMEMALTRNPTFREGRRGASTEGTVTRWRYENGEWHPARERLLVTVDTMWNFGPGDRITFRGYVNPIADSAGTGSENTAGSSDRNSYARLMRARGFTGRTYITQYSRPTRAPEKARTIALWAGQLQTAATERLRRLAPGPDPAPENSILENPATENPALQNSAQKEAIAVAAAMTTGDRSGITPKLRQAYSRTGASHLLAVSGLHVGIVFLIVNSLLHLLPMIRGGHIARNLVAVAVIWFYAALTGGSPSATRAAFMFTGGQLALAASQQRSPANIMCGVAVVMLALWPGLLFDISFQLSFLAVAGIMGWFGPVFGLVRSRWRILNALWSTLIIGGVASLATMPLVSHTFGIFAPAGVVLNPVVIATAWLVIVFSLIWIAFPAAWSEPVFGWLVGGPAWFQNRVVELAAGVPGMALEWRMPAWMVFAIYGAMALLTLWLHSGLQTSRPGTPTGDGNGNEPFTLPR
jgi:competence protein ComEC